MNLDQSINFNYSVLNRLSQLSYYFLKERFFNEAYVETGNGEHTEKIDLLYYNSNKSILFNIDKNNVLHTIYYVHNTELHRDSYPLTQKNISTQIENIFFELQMFSTDFTTDIIH